MVLIGSLGFVYSMNIKRMTANDAKNERSMHACSCCE